VLNQRHVKSFRFFFLLLQVTGTCQDSALGAPIFADCTSAGAMPALFAGAGIYQARTRGWSEMMPVKL
jgi:hypothetical protein